MKLQISTLFLLIGTICAQERSISGATRRNRFSAGKSHSINFNCPEDFGYYPHPSDCSQYYVCVFGGALLESCTGGLMYSTELQTCDWPRNVVCKASAGPGVSTVKITDPRTRSTESNSIHSATESLSSSSIINRGLDNTITNRQPVKSSGLSKSIFDDAVKPRQGRFLSNQEDPQRIDSGFQAQETSSRTFNVVPASATPKSKLSFPWKSYLKKKSRRPRDAELGRRHDASSQNSQLSFFDNSHSRDPFDISLPTSAIFSAGPRDRHNRQIGRNQNNPFVLPSFISSSFRNPFEPRHHRERRPFQHSEEVSQHHHGRERHRPHLSDHRRDTFHSNSNSFVPSPPESYPEPFIPNFHSQERTVSPNHQKPSHDFHPPVSSPTHVQRDRVQRHPVSEHHTPRGPPKSIASSNFALNYPPSLSNAFEDPFFTRPRSPYDDHQTNSNPYFHESKHNENTDNRRPDHKATSNPYFHDNKYNENAYNRRPGHNYNDARDNSNTDHNRNTIKHYNPDYKERFNRKPDFEPIPNLQSHTESQHPIHEQNYQHQNHKFIPPPIEGSVLLTPPDDFNELQNISDEEESISGKHIETDNSPKPLNEPNRIPIPKLKTRVIPTKRKPNVETSTSKQIQGQVSEKISSRPPKRPLRGQSPKFRPRVRNKQTLRKPPHIPGTARHPELSKLSAIGDKSPSLPVPSNTNRFSSIRSTTQSPTTEAYGDLLNSNDTDYYYYYDDILYDDYYEPTSQKSTTAVPVVRSSNRGSSRSKPKTQSAAPTSGGIPQLVGRTPQRPNPVYPQPQVDLPASPCDPAVCVLPDCYCGGRNIPGNIPATSVPQLVLLTFDDAVNDLNKGLYKDLFEVGRINPNGCPIAATFYVSHEWTDYTQVQNLYSDGHEIASHSVTHSFGEQFSTPKWSKEVGGQREIMSAYAGVRMEDIRGMRAPFLAVGGNNMFRMLYDLNFTYDSSMPVYENNPPSWPYTLDYKIFHDCMIPPCPTNSYPGVWQIPMVMWQDLTGGRCSMADACTTPPDAEGVYKMLIKNFERHYTTNRSPFGLFYHAAWFTTTHHKEGFIAFLDTISAMDDVWLITNWQALQWMRDPTPLSKAKSFPPFQCDYPERPPRCTTPKVCNVWHKGSVRYLKTCYTCPESYPWTGNTGVQSPLNDV